MNMEVEIGAEAQGVDLPIFRSLLLLLRTAATPTVGPTAYSGSC